MAAGLAAGDDHALSLYRAVREPAVQAYISRVCSLDTDFAAAVEASFTAFMESPQRSTLSSDTEADELLLRMTRAEAAARTAPLPRAQPPGLLGALGRGRRDETACRTMPALLAARASGQLSEEDRQRVQRHLDRCFECRTLAARFDRGEQAFATNRSRPEAAVRERLKRGDSDRALPALAKADKQTRPDTPPPPAKPQTWPTPSPSPPKDMSMDANLARERAAAAPKAFPGGTPPGRRLPWWTIAIVLVVAALIGGAVLLALRGGTPVDSPVEVAPIPDSEMTKAERHDARTVPLFDPAGIEVLVLNSSGNNQAPRIAVDRLQVGGFNRARAGGDGQSIDVTTVLYPEEGRTAEREALAAKRKLLPLRRVQMQPVPPREMQEAGRGADLVVLVADDIIDQP